MSAQHYQLEWDWDEEEQACIGQAPETIGAALRCYGVAILPPLDVFESIALVEKSQIRPKAIILDPWYNKGYGGVREDYQHLIIELLKRCSNIADHIFLWGFPEIVATFVDKLPEPLYLVAWLTWYYKNNPSVIRGWRSSQNACLHLAKPGAKLYPEHFLNDAQRAKLAQGKLRYMPGPTSVIEAPLLVGFVGKQEQTGHPAQKPVAVFEPLILMTTEEGDIVFDPMSGSGTTAVAARKHGRLAIISDISEEYTQVAEQRLKVPRVKLAELSWRAK